MLSVFRKYTNGQNVFSEDKSLLGADSDEYVNEESARITESKLEFHNGMKVSIWEPPKTSPRVKIGRNLQTKIDLAE